MLKFPTALLVLFCFLLLIFAEEDSLSQALRNRAQEDRQLKENFETVISTKSPATPTPPCFPKDGLNKEECDKIIRICGHKGIKMKWNSKGCVVTKETSNHKKVHVRAKDSGCQCDEYCAYSCEPACTNDPQCFWQNSTCFSHLTGQPGFKMPFCPPSQRPQ